MENLAHSASFDSELKGSPSKLEIEHLAVPDLIADLDEKSSAFVATVRTDLHFAMSHGGNVLAQSDGIG